METVVDSDEVFYLAVSDSLIILKSKENKENCHKDGLSYFYSNINLYGKIFNFVDIQWSQITLLIIKMFRL